MKKTPPEAEKIIKKLNLKELKTITRGFHNYGSLCENEKGENLYLKVRLYPDLVSKENFAKEVALTKFLSDNFYGNPHFLTPKYYGSETDNSPEWLLREFPKGERMGDTWGFNQDFYNIISPEKMSRVFEFLRTDISEKFSRAPIERKKEFFLVQTNEEYKNYFQFYRNFVKNFINDDLTEKSLEIFKKNSEVLNKNGILAHNDLHPGNVIVAGKDAIMIHDWKYSCFDNLCLDFVFFWSLSWLDEKWRNRLFQLEEEKAKNKNLFNLFFHLSVLKLTPKIISILIQSSAISKNDLEKGLNKILKVFQESIKKLN